MVVKMIGVVALFFLSSLAVPVNAESENGDIVTFIKILAKQMEEMKVEIKTLKQSENEMKKVIEGKLEKHEVKLENMKKKQNDDLINIFRHLGGKRELKYDKRPMTWLQAEQQCIKWGGHLLTIISRKGNEYILNELKSRNMQTVWIGFNDRSQEGDFVWVEGLPTLYTNWNKGEPNGGRNENCVQIGGTVGIWNDLNCTYWKLPFVCERHNLEMMTVIEEKLETHEEKINSLNKSEEEMKKVIDPKLEKHEVQLESMKRKHNNDVINIFRHIGGKHELRYDKRPMTWLQAEQECVKWGGHLVTIISRKGNEYILNELKSRNMQTVWIGFNDRSQEGDFIWVEGSPTLYTNWNKGEPNGGRNENCVQIGGTVGIWNDLNCTYWKLPFVCERYNLQN